MAKVIMVRFHESIWHTTIAMHVHKYVPNETEAWKKILEEELVHVWLAVRLFYQFHSNFLDTIVNVNNGTQPSCIIVKLGDTCFPVTIKPAPSVYRLQYHSVVAKSGFVIVTNFQVVVVTHHIEGVQTFPLL